MENKKIVLKGQFEDVIYDSGRYYITHKFDKICVLPYTISAEGLLDKIGVIKELDLITQKNNLTLINGYINDDDATNLVGANRLLYEIIGSNIKSADLWMYLGNITNIVGSNGLIIYCVNITNIDINESENVEEEKKARKFEMINANEVVVSDDATFLAAYMRMFNFFYVTSLK